MSFIDSFSDEYFPSNSSHQNWLLALTYATWREHNKTPTIRPRYRIVQSMNSWLIMKQSKVPAESDGKPVDELDNRGKDRKTLRSWRWSRTTSSWGSAQTLQRKMTVHRLMSLGFCWNNFCAPEHYEGAWRRVVNMITVREAMGAGLSDVASNEGHVLLKVSYCPGIARLWIVALNIIWHVL